MRQDHCSQCTQSRAEGCLMAKTSTITLRSNKLKQEEPRLQPCLMRYLNTCPRRCSVESKLNPSSQAESTLWVGFHLCGCLVLLIPATQSSALGLLSSGVGERMVLQMVSQGKEEALQRTAFLEENRNQQKHMARRKYCEVMYK